MRFAAAYAWKVASLIHMEIMQSRYEGSFSSASVAQVRSPNFYQSTANFRKALARPATGPVWSCWWNFRRVLKDAGVPSTTPRGQQQQGVVETPVYKRTVLIRMRAPSGNASVAAMQSFVVGLTAYDRTAFASG